MVIKFYSSPRTFLAKIQIIQVVSAFIYICEKGTQEEKGVGRMQSQIDEDSKQLKQFGYQQELNRALGLFSNFSVAFTYLSPVVGIYSLYAFGLQTSGPAFIWSIPIVVIGQMMVVLIFSELATTYPISGALYQWARRLLTPGYGWFVGWIYTWALLVTIASVDFGGAPYAWGIFGVNAPTQGENILMTIILLAIQTVVNWVGVKVLRQLAFIGFLMEILGTVILGIILLFFGHQSAGVIVHTNHVQGHGSYAPLFILGLLFSAFIFFGFESAGDVAEEVVDPRRRVPKAMILTLVIGGIVSFFLTFAFLHATPNMSLSMDAAKTPNPISYILDTNLGGVMSRVFLWVIVLAYLSCGASIQAATTRVIYSYARDKVVPGHRWLAKISKQKTPANALLISAVLTLIFSLSAKVESLLTSFAVVGIYLAFQLIMLASLIARSKGWRPKGFFDLGAWAWPVTIIGLIYGIGMMVNLARPTNPTAPWYINYEVLLSTAVIVIVGFLVYLTQRRKIAALDDIGKHTLSAVRDSHTAGR